MDPKVTELYNDYIHGDMPRRTFLRQLAGITGGAAMTPARPVTTRQRQNCPGGAASVSSTTILNPDLVKGAFCLSCF